MRKLILAAGVAALAVVSPAAAKPDKGGGQAQAHKGGGGPAKAERQSGGGRAFTMQGGGERKAQRLERRGGGERRQFALERRGGGERKAQRLERRGGEPRFAVMQSKREERRAQRVERLERRDFARFETGKRGKEHIKIRDRKDLVRGGDAIRIRGFDGDRRLVLRDNDNYAFRDSFRRVAEWRDWDERDWDRRFGSRGIPAAFVGCPPGLAKKSPACVPPGLARAALVGSVLPSVYASNYIPVDLRDIYYDTDDYYWRFGDGYAYRVDRDDALVAAVLPLIGAGLGIGMPFPYSGPSYYVPSYYEPFYPAYGDDYYRYANGYVYEIDGPTGLIEDVVPLLDHGYGVGQILPAGYSTYNVPYQYRDVYYDTPDYSYRYAPGAIYQVDRDTQLITAIASLLTGGLAVGQPLPPAYSAYNVPLGYRDMYYDRPDAWYRYSDGYIYQVDPTTQLITAIVRAIV